MEGAADGFLAGEAALVEDLGAGAARGGAVSLASQAVKFCARLALVMAMGRLVSPEDLGAYAMVEAACYFLDQFKDLGLSAATVQGRALDERQVSLLFWTNASFGVLLAAATAALAPALAWFYREPRVAPLAAALGVTFALSGLSAQHQALLQRRMRFVTLEAIAVACQLFSGAVMVAFAWRGAGCWAYVLGALASAALNLALVWAACDWRPGPPRLRSGARGLFVYGRAVTGARVVDFLHRNLDNALVGRYCGAGALGLYARAYSLLLQPIVQVFNPLSNVMLPALSRVQDQPARLREYALAAATAAGLLSMPLVVFTFVDTREIILVLVGPRWLGALPIFHALAPAAFFTAPVQVSTWVLLALGRADRLLKAGAAACAAMCAAFALGLRWGPLGVAAAYSAAYCLSCGPVLCYSLRGAPVSAADVAGSLWRPALASLAAGALLLRARALLPATPPPALKAAGDAAAYLVCYLACWLLLPGGRGQLLELIRRCPWVPQPLLGATARR